MLKLYNISSGNQYLLQDKKSVNTVNILAVVILISDNFMFI
jgi:hypothetical protein